MSFQLVSILKGAHLSVLLFFMKGPYDDDLYCYNMAIKRKICFKLLNQISDYLNIVLMWLLPQIIPAGRVTDRNKVNFGGDIQSSFPMKISTRWSLLHVSTSLYLPNCRTTVAI